MRTGFPKNLARAWRVIGLAAALAALAPATTRAADPAAPADITVTDTVLKPAAKVPPLGANNWGRVGAVEWAANNFVHNAGNEPVYWRNQHRVVECGPNWFEIDGPGTSWYDLWASGFLSGADVRIYRLVDKDGLPLPPNADGKNLDTKNEDHVVLVGKTQIVPEGDKKLPDGGWVANKYAPVYPNDAIRGGNLGTVDAQNVVNGREVWYTVVAVGANGQASDISNEVSVTAKAGAASPIAILNSNDDVQPMSAGKDFTLAPKAVHGKAPLKWEVVDAAGKALALPDGLKLDPATGAIAGKPTADVAELKFSLKVTDADGKSATRAYQSRLQKPAADAADKTKPEPPKDLKAVAGDGCVTLTWTASPTPDVVRYSLRRSTAPAAKQEARVHLADGAPALQKFDYIVLSKRFGNFDMKYVNQRVRGIGNPTDVANWYWQSANKTAVAFSAVPHPQPVPAELTEPGETCLQAKAEAGEQSINQIVFIGTNHAGESLWYGQLEPGKKYHLDVWLRQEGLANNGAVTFNYAKGYPDITKTFPVTGEWKKYTFDFAGPERPVDPWHFGHTFTFTGPGTLWMENCRVARVDKPEDADKLYVPNATVLDELLKSQPEKGPKGAHRIWFLDRDATMSSILSWHANSKASPDWSTGAGGTMDMTLPMGLSFDLATGADPQSRMRPWLVLQHILHTEDDWQHFVEYLAAPYDAKTDTPKTKPWAYMRTQQRGVATPWTDEFASITVEFGNETWHNGIFPDWLGFALRNQVHQGGNEYGLFTRYLVAEMKKSPYWKSQNLDKKILFDLGANYDTRVEANGTVRGYGEEAMARNPEATLVGHANYVGPKWETGDYSARTYDDHGVQECLISYLTGVVDSQTKMSEGHDALVKMRPEYDIVAYEGGPGGYALPGGGVSAEQVETNEKYGKSLAQGVGAFDAWMDSYRLGWTDQCFLGYGQGNHWNSHTTFADGFRATPAWLALALRNRVGSGDLMTVTVNKTPTLARKEKAKDKETVKEIPLVGAYAMRDGKRWTVFVVSRKLNGNHDNVDFGDGSTPVTVHLPFQKTQKITLTKLTGDPRLSNRDKMNIAPQPVDVPGDSLQAGAMAVTEKTGGVAGGMPAGSIFAYVFEGAE